MHLARILQPPGSAPALIAVTGSAKIHCLGFYYVLQPATASPLLIRLVSRMFNKLARSGATRKSAFEVLKKAVGHGRP